MSLPYSASTWETPAMHKMRDDLTFYRGRVVTMKFNIEAAQEARDRARLAVLSHEITGALHRQHEAEKAYLAMRIPYLEARIEEMEVLAGDETDQTSYETALDLLRDDLSRAQTRHKELRGEGVDE